VSVLLLEQHGRFPFAVADEVLSMDRGLLLGPVAGSAEPVMQQEVTR
jgi:hypothetical protein